MYKNLFLLFPLVISTFAFAQDESASADASVEEVVVIGSQIRGAKITGSLPVTVISSDDMDALGIDSGDELLDNIAEFGQNTFNQNEFSGGYNAARGDIGAFNLRDIGTGNTLSLLNGRRLITAPGYQTEPILGGTIPVMTVNSNAIPTGGADRIEILRDGASAIYGADAVAGVINTVLKSDFVGLNVKFKVIGYDAYNAEDYKTNIQWGKDFGNTNVSVYFDNYVREKIAGNEDPKWLAQDARKSPGLGIFAGSAWDDTSWRNNNAASQYGIWSGGSGYLHTRPDTGGCAYTGTGGNTCIYKSNSNNPNSDTLRAYYNETRWMRPELDRNNLFVFINTELDSGVEAYTEISGYNSSATQQLYGGTTLGAGGCGKAGNCTQPYLVPLSNYWLNQLVDGSGGKLVDSSLITNGLGVWKARHRFNTPRGYTSHRTTLRFLQGFRGRSGNWDWDTAIVWSQAKSKQNNTGRQSLTLLNESLALSTPNAYNPFCGGNGCSDESAFTVDIVRENGSSMYMWDFKMSNPDLYSLPSGSIEMLLGFEARKESYSDIRDPRLNGEQNYTVPVGPLTGTTFPIVSDIVNSSATPNSGGSRNTYSFFTEVAIPVTEDINVQLALRAEDSSDYGEHVVSKLAIGWQVIDQVKLRYSSSETFRAPPLILINEGFLGRSVSTNDALFDVAYGSDQDNYSMQRINQGNPDLKPELGENESMGIVIEPIDNLIITVDKWSIVTEDTLGVFGMTNAVLLDALIRIEGGVSECTGNPLVKRYAYAGASGDAGTETWSSSLCPAGQVQNLDDFYLNADTRTIEGMDTSIVYSLDTKFGNFGAKFVNVHYDTKNQEAGGDAKRLSDAAQPGGALADLASPRGINNLLGLNGNIEDKYTMRLSYRIGPYEAFLSGTQFGEFYESAHTETIDGVREMWVVDSMTMLNLTLGYKFKNDLRLRVQVKNIEDARAPLADETFSMYWGDLHTDFGRNYNVEIFKKF